VWWTKSLGLELLTVNSTKQLIRFYSQASIFKLLTLAAFREMNKKRGAPKKFVLF
jgi:hypothetical protein